MRFFKGEKPPYRGVAYRPDGRTLITATQSGVVTLWDLDAGHELTPLKGKPGPPYRLPRIDTMALSPDGRLLAATGRDLTVWDLETGVEAAGFESANITFRGVTFALTGSRLVAGAGSFNGVFFRGYGLAMWETADGRSLPTLRTAGDAHPLTAGPDGESVFGVSGYK